MSRNIIRRVLSVQYRLTVWQGGKPQNFYATRRETLGGYIRTAVREGHLWTLYKRGPFGLPERMVDTGDRESQFNR